MKPRLRFYTNMPTPYQLDFFEAISFHFSLEVTYFTYRESDRQWSLNSTDVGYRSNVFKEGFLTRLIQKKIPSFHFSIQVFKSAFSDTSDFIILNGTYWTPNIVLLAAIYKLRRKKTYFYGEPLLPDAGGLKSFLKSVAFLPIRCFTSGILAIGIRAVESYRSLGYRKKIVNIPYNISTNAFSISAINEGRISDIRQQLGIDGHTVFITSGSLIERKGIDIVIKAFLRSYSGKSKLLILGDGPERDSLLQLSAGNSDIHFLGFIDSERIPLYYNVSDVFVFASRYDGWAVVINEAIAAGLPIISSDAVGATADLLTHNKNAIICISENVRQFSDAISLLKDNTAVRRRLASEIHLLVESVSSVNNAWKLYDFLRVDQ